jgi:predicted O-linked N-acetylglucosamine transferase (SPINDLY family)
LATDDEEQFLKVAAELAKDLPGLRELRLTMRDRLLASPLMDHRRFAKDLEQAYRAMWRAWCDSVA